MHEMGVAYIPAQLDEQLAIWMAEPETLSRARGARY